jgi:hypothetical protein
MSCQLAFSRLRVIHGVAYCDYITSLCLAGDKKRRRRIVTQCGKHSQSHLTLVSLHMPVIEMWKYLTYNMCRKRRTARRFSLLMEWLDPASLPSTNLCFSSLLPFFEIMDGHIAFISLGPVYAIHTVVLVAVLQLWC